jgi:ABC-type uncharacterized transport system substrate-binding protein
MTALISAVFAAMAPAPAWAHPHVWVAARAEILFDAQGEIAAVRHIWTFDEMYSAFAAQGLGKDGRPPTQEDLAPLAKTNVESLAEFQYFTAVKTGPTYHEFGEPVDYALEANEKKIVTLRFTLPLKAPVAPKKPVTFMIYDPTYFVSVELAQPNPVALRNAPAGCSMTTIKPEPLTVSDQGKLNESYLSGLAPGQDFGVKLAPRTLVACP